MQSNRLIKILTVSGFVILITGFISYRSGLFNSPIGNVDKETLIETSILKVDEKIIEDPEIISSSKSMLIYDETKISEIETQDDPKQERILNSHNSQGLTELNIMSSSKTMILASPYESHTKIISFTSITPLQSVAVPTKINQKN